MDDAVIVGMLHPLAYLSEDRHQLGELQYAPVAHQLLEAFSFEIVGHQVEQIVAVDAEVENLQDISVVELAQNAGLALEAQDLLLLLRDCRLHDFDCHPASQDPVLCQEDRPHAAGSQGLLDLEAVIESETSGIEWI